MRTANNLSSLPDDRATYDLHADLQLAQSCQAGSKSALEQLIQQNEGWLYKLGLGLSGNPADAEDFTHDVFLRVFESLGSYRAECPLSAWIKTIAFNLKKTRVGRAIRDRLHLDSHFDPAQLDAVESDEQRADERLGESEEQTRIQRALEGLPLLYRDAITLRDLQGMSYQEIAAALGLPIGTVRSRIARGREWLMQTLGETE